MNCYQAHYIQYQFISWYKSPISVILILILNSRPTYIDEIYILYELNCSLIITVLNKKEDINHTCYDN